MRRRQGVTQSLTQRRPPFPVNIFWILIVRPPAEIRFPHDPKYLIMLGQHREQGNLFVILGRKSCELNQLLVHSGTESAENVQ
jgi:hypothetical protein